MKNLKQRLAKGETLNGCWMNLGSPLTAEIIGHAGFDWVLIDLEHSSSSENDVLLQLQALESSPTAAIVRVETPEGPRISKVMDIGAEGVMCPKINTAEEARKVVSGLHYPPFGNRGVSTMIRPTAYGKTWDSYYENSKDNFLGIVQIETVEALNNLDEIASTEGVDVLFIGPADLTIDMGIFGQFENPKYIDAVEKIVAAAKKAGKSTGILFFNPDDYKKYHDMGIKFIACGSDAYFLSEGAKNMAKKLSESRD
ncbi:MAG: HpcH/HpaI aldolase/citrate lyase family protein [Bacteroidota bacterium]